MIAPYLYFRGNCKDAFDFYHSVLGGKITSMTFGQSPMAAECDPGMLDQLMHVRIVVGDSILMGSDSPPQYWTASGGFAISYSVDTPEEGKKIFDALSDGGQIVMPLEKTFWSEAFGMLEDKFGISWMINCGPM